MNQKLALAGEVSLAQPEFWTSGTEKPGSNAELK
jgi:hypothetical protein